MKLYENNPQQNLIGKVFVFLNYTKGEPIVVCVEKINQSNVFVKDVSLEKIQEGGVENGNPIPDIWTLTENKTSEMRILRQNKCFHDILSLAGGNSDFHYEELKTSNILRMPRNYSTGSPTTF